MKSRSRDHYILHPPTGESLDEPGVSAIRKLAARHAGASDPSLRPGLAAAQTGDLLRQLTARR